MCDASTTEPDDLSDRLLGRMEGSISWLIARFSIDMQLVCQHVRRRPEPKLNHLCMLLTSDYRKNITARYLQSSQSVRK
jgi:hypothetical protein